MLIADAEVAFLQADEPGELYVQPALSVCAPERCWKLCKSTYGNRQASRNWHSKVAEVAKSHGQRRLESCPCIWMHDGLKVYVLVHGGDLHV